MRWLWVVCLALLAGLLQVSLMGAWRIGGVVPNLALVVVVLAAIWRTASESLLVAVICGLIIDLWSGGAFGLAISSLVLVSLSLLALRQAGINGNQFAGRLILTVGATLLWAIIHIVSIAPSAFLNGATWRIILIELVVNGGLLIFLPKKVIGETSTL